MRPPKHRINQGKERLTKELATARRIAPEMQKIHAERKRQIEEEGWTPEHDAQHDGGEMLRAAVLYYAHAKDEPMTLREDGAPIGWPWEAKSWKPKDRERDLVRAGALCLAERERLRRIRGSYCGHVDQKLLLIVEALALP